MKATNGAVSSRKAVLWPVGIFAGALILYVATCAPGVVWQDAGRMQYRVLHNDIEGRLGLALSHPLFHLVAIGAKYVPAGEVAYKVNLVSAFCGALAVMNLFVLLRLWLGKELPALFGAVSLALSHTFWRHATIPETYDLYVAILLLELITLLQYLRSRHVRYLYLLGLFNGLAVADHVLGLIPLTCYAVLLLVLWRKRQVRPGQCAVVGLLWMLGAAPYEYLVLKNIFQTGDVAGTLASALFGNSWAGAVLNTSLSVKILKENALFLLLNFPTPNLAFFLVGLYGLYRTAPSRSFAHVLLALLVLFFAFASRYPVPDRYVFFIPFYGVLAALMAVGFHVATGHKKCKILCRAALVLTLLPIPAYMIAPAAARRVNLFAGMRQIPYRDPYRYFLQPWRTGYRGAERFAEKALRQVEPDAILCADSTTLYVLLYVQEVKHLRPDVKLLGIPSPEVTEQTIERTLKRQSVYVVSNVPGYCPAFLLKRYEFERTGVLWRVQSKRRPSSTQPHRAP